MTKAIPDGFHTLTPHIVVRDAAKAVEFYKKAFGAQAISRLMTPDGKVRHARPTESRQLHAYARQ